MNIGSLASMTALGRGHIAYSMAMGAVVQMTRELSTEWSRRGVRVNCDPARAGRQPEPRQRAWQHDPTLEDQWLQRHPRWATRQAD